MHGLVKFELGRGTKLATYLLYWIRQSISAAISAFGKIIRIPRTHQYTILHIKRHRSHLLHELKR